MMTQDQYIEYEGRFFFRRNMRWYENDIDNPVTSGVLSGELTWKLFGNGFDEKLQKYRNELDYEEHKSLIDFIDDGGK